MSIPALLLAAPSNNSGSGSLGFILPLVLIVAVGYFLFIRPTRARQKRAQELRSDLEVGAEVMTTAGLFGRVAQVDDESLLLEVAPGVTMRFVKAAVAKVVTPVEAVTDAEETGGEASPEQPRSNPERPDGSGPLGEER